MKRVKTWIFTSPGNVPPLTGSSPQRIMLLSRSTLATWMSLADTLAHSPFLLFVALSVPRVMPTMVLRDFGRKRKLKSDDSKDKTNVSEEASSTISSDDINNVIGANTRYEEASLLDLYSGCGAMSTGLSLGANMAGVKLVTRWAMDLNKHACEGFRWNHPETMVRDEAAEDSF